MESPDLLLVCISAFIAVFLILLLLALIMMAITAIFPQKKQTTDPALVAAIHSTYNAIYPGNKITKIEEVQ